MSSRFEDKARLERIKLEKKVQDMRLEPFNELFVKEYLEAVFDEKALSPRFQSAIPYIHEKVGGNPFFLQELIMSMIVNTVIVRKTRFWDLDQPFVKSDIPTNLKALIGSRLSRLSLSSQEMEILQIIALLNRKISWEELNAIIPVNISFLNKLEELEILKQEFLENQSFYKAAHHIIREAIIQANQHPKKLHELIANRLEVIHVNDLDIYIEELVFHYQKTDNRDKSLLYLQIAADKAKAIFENEKALDLFTTIYNLLDETQCLEKSEVLLKKASLYIYIGDLPLCIEMNKKAYAFAEAGKDYSNAARALWMHSHCLIETGDQTCEPLARKALKLAQQTKNGEIIARSFNVLALYYSRFVKDYEKAIAFHTQGIRIAQEYNSLIGICGNMINLAVLFNAMGNFTKAIEYSTKVSMLDGVVQRNRALNYGMLGTYHTSAGNYSIALDCFDKGILLCKKFSCYAVETEIRVRKTIALFSMKRFKEAYKACNLAKSMINKTFEKSIIFMFKIIAAKLAYIFNEKGAAKQDLIDLLENYKNPDEIAEINYELWCMEREEIHRNKALKLYKEMCEKAQDYTYKKRLKHLQENKPEIYSHAKELRSRQMRQRYTSNTFFKRC